MSLWDVHTGDKLHELAGHEPFTFAPDGLSLAAGIVKNGQEQIGINLLPLETQLWNLFSPENNQQRAVLKNIKQAAEFLWQRKVDGLDIVENRRQPRLYPLNDYFFEHEDRMRPLLDPPAPDQSKFDQVYQWAIEQAKQE